MLTIMTQTVLSEDVNIIGYTSDYDNLEQIIHTSVSHHPVIKFDRHVTRIKL